MDDDTISREFLILIKKITKSENDCAEICNNKLFTKKKGFVLKRYSENNSVSCRMCQYLDHYWNLNTPSHKFQARNLFITIFNRVETFSINLYKRSDKSGYACRLFTISIISHTHRFCALEDVTNFRNNKFEYFLQTINFALS